MAAALVAEDGRRGCRQHANGPHGIGMAVEGGLGVHAAPFPDPHRGVLPAGEHPAIAQGATTVQEVGGGRSSRQAHDRACVAAMGEVARNVEVVRGRAVTAKC